ncbi:1396_t:CDS:2 [Funneliformis mosseae]|uniref:Ataxin-10 homolog n=1 Tax=Funneliformis mosseae TaxID=27381 RepID=A0A9N8YYD4_FUNMO|nr:1396_t:CDS:2 [Funneliformis mosseae]
MEFTKSDVIVQQLGNYSNDPLNNLDSIIKLLKQITFTTQSNLTYRETLGNKFQFWIVTTKLWEWSKEKFLKEELIVLPIVLELVRLFRNIVAAVSENQNQALEHKWNKITEEILWYSMLKFNSEADNNFISIIRFGSQALSNAITGNAGAQEIIWSDYTNRNESNDILSELVKCEDSVVLTGALILVYNCVHESESRRYALVSRLIDFSLFPLLYDSLSQPQRQAPTRHQIILLKILDSKFFSSLKIDEFSISLCVCIIRAFHSICHQVIYSMQLVENDSIMHSKSQDDQQHEGSRLLYTGLVLFLQCIGKMSQEGDKKVRECLFKEGIIASSICKADKSLPRMTKATDTQISHTFQQASSGFAFIKRDIVKIIGNMAYENKIVQDEVRELGGIPLILNQCNIDDNNPYIREHAIFALRNILIHNPENQKLVEQLAPIETVQHSALQDVGIMTELGKDGKIKLTTNVRK